MKNINLIIIITIIMLSGVLIGTPINSSNIQPVYVIIGIHSIIYFVHKIIKKQKLKLNKIDICIIILTLSTLIPLIFKTYVSLSEQIYGIIKAFCILNFYIITKKEIKENPKNREIIVNTIIISIFLLCIIGLDEVTFNKLENIKEFIGYEQVEDDEIRINSLFSYPNTMAIVAGVGVFLCLGNLFEAKKKIPYIIAITVMFITFVLTYSRLAFIVFALIGLIYIAVLVKKYEIKISRKLILAGVFVIIFVALYIFIGLKVQAEIHIKNQYQKIMYTANSDEDYVFELNIEDCENAVIKIIEKNQYFDDVETTEFEINDFTGVKEIKIHTQDATSVIYFEIENKSDSEFIIKSARLNGEKFILKYKILPTKIVDKIQSISLKNKSAWERLTFISDATELIKENWVFGLGTNAWRTMQLKVQEYNYYAQEVHCYPIQVFLENGISEFLAVLIIYIFIIKSFVASVKKEKLNMITISNIIAVMLILVHSFLDFDMSFFYVQILAFTILAISCEEEKEYELSFSGIMYAILIGASIFSVYCSTIEICYANNPNVKKKGAVWNNSKLFENYYNLIPYNYNLKIAEYNVLLNYGDTRVAEMENLLKDMLEQEKYSITNIKLTYISMYVNIAYDSDLEFVLDYICETEDLAKYQTEIQISRFQNIKTIIEIVKQQGKDDIAEKFEQQLLKEIAEKEEYILDYEKSRYDSENKENYEEILQQLKIEITGG